MDHSFTPEDMCQARAFRHYENIRRTAGGISEIMEVLSNSDRAERDKAQFL